MKKTFLLMAITTVGISFGQGKMQYPQTKKEKLSMFTLIPK